MFQVFKKLFENAGIYSALRNCAGSFFIMYVSRFDRNIGFQDVPQGFTISLWGEAISTWCEASRGEISLDTALEALLKAAGAEAGTLVRVNHPEGNDRRIAIADRRSGAIALQRTYARDAIGENLKAARVGSVWVQSAGDLQDTPALCDFQTGHRFGDLIVLVLSSAGRSQDLLELHFRDRLVPGAQEMLSGMLSVLVRNWATRPVGLVSRSTIEARTAPKGIRPRPVDILGPANPAQLSRAEFRVSLLLSRGLTVQGLCAELDLSEATVRSHLRSIYAKLDTSSLAELVYLLISDSRRAAETPISKIA